MRAAVVVEHRLDPLLPLATLMRERVPRADPRAQIEDVLGRDPRLRQPVDHQQLAQMPGVRTIGLRALLVALAGARLRRLGQMHLRADPAQLLDHEPPPGRRLQRHLELLAGETLKEPAHAGAIGRRHPPARHLAGRRVDPLRGDLRPMLIQAHHDRHPPTPFPSPPSASSTTRAVTRAASSPTHRIPWITVGPPIRMAGRAGCNRARLRPMPFDAEARPPSPRPHANPDMTSFVCRGASPRRGRVSVCAASATQCPAVFASSWLALGPERARIPLTRGRPDRLGRQRQADGPPQRAWHGSGRAPRRRRRSRPTCG